MAESWQDFYDLGKATLQTRRPRLVVEEGDVTDAIIAGTASMATALVAYSNRQFKATFLDGAEKSDLTERARDRGVERNVGAASMGSISLIRPSVGLGAGTIPSGTRVATEADSTGVFATFVIDNDVVFGGADLSKTNVVARCSIVGKIGNISENKIIRFIDNVFDPSIVPSNPTHFTGGVGEESDEELRDRVRGFFLTQARGTIDALDYGARQVAGVDRVSIVVDESGVVTVYIADADGNSNAVLVEAVRVELEKWRDAADVVYVTGGVIVNQAVSLTVTVRTGVDINALLSRIREAIISRIGRLNPGEVLYRDMISAACRDVDRGAIIGVDVITPAANVAPLPNQLIRTNTGIVTFI